MNRLYSLSYPLPSLINIFILTPPCPFLFCLWYLLSPLLFPTHLWELIWTNLCFIILSPYYSSLYLSAWVREEDHNIMALETKSQNPCVNIAYPPSSISQSRWPSVCLAVFSPCVQLWWISSYFQRLSFELQHFSALCPTLSPATSFSEYPTSLLCNLPSTLSTICNMFFTSCLRKRGMKSWEQLREEEKFEWKVREHDQVIYL